MKTIETTVYNYSELSEKAQAKARDWYLEGNDFYHLWDDTKEDAKTIGLTILELNTHKRSRGSFITDATDCANLIIANHGQACETYKTAQAYLSAISALPVFPEDHDNMTGAQYEAYREVEEQKEEIENNFLKSLLEDYRIMHEKDLEYNQSEEAIAEMMEANDYTFLENGTRF